MNWSRREAFSPSPMGCLQDAYATYIKLAKLWGNYSHTDGQRLTNGQWFKECRRFTQRDIQPYGKCGFTPVNHTVYRHLSIAQFGIEGRCGGDGGLGGAERTASAIPGGCALRRSSSGTSWGTTLTIPHTPSSRPASDTGCQRGRSRESEAPMAKRSLRSSVPTHHTTGIERPRCVDRLPSHISKTVVSTVRGGGPILTIDRTVFELWLGTL